VSAAISSGDRELHYIAAATVCGYDLTADCFPRAERTQIQILGRITEWGTKIYSRIPWPRRRARYIKEVDVNERTVRFAQEIYDSTARLVAVHEKFPVDLGHQQA
jgi:hypothetical protein